MVNNLFLYWEGKKYPLIEELHKLMYLHAKDNYTIHLINHTNVRKYVKDLPECFFRLKYAHQADFVRVNVICDYGGIWLDSDVVMIDGKQMREMFNLINDCNGYFCITPQGRICNNNFGSNPNTELMLEWKRESWNVLSKEGEKIAWNRIGSTLLGKYHRQGKLNSYFLLSGKKTVIPVPWFINKHRLLDCKFDDWKSLVRPFQPYLVLTNKIYKAVGQKNVFEMCCPLNYFIAKSYDNL